MIVEIKCKKKNIGKKRDKYKQIRNKITNK